jgi:hypothetical protein
MRLACSKVHSKSKSDAPSTTKEKLRTYNGKDEHWLNSNRELTAYLNQIHNNDGVPIYYVIRDPDNEEEYRTINDELGNRIYDAPFRGRTYEEEAFKFYKSCAYGHPDARLKPTLVTIIMYRTLGQQLVSSYEGLDARNTNIQLARSTNKKSSWSHNSHTYTFDDDCNKHFKSNKDLDRYGANVDNESQVQAFLDDIKGADRNSTISAIKVVVKQSHSIQGCTTIK